MIDAMTITKPGRRLTELNDKISQWLGEVEDNVYLIVEALKEVNTQKLYKLTHETFTSYFNQTFRKHKERGCQFLNFAGIVDNDGQASALIGVGPEVQAMAIDLVGDDQSTAKLQEALAVAEVEVVKKAERKTAAIRKERQDNEQLNRIKHYLNKAYRLVDGSIDQADELAAAIQRALEVAGA
jgi:uncharacterized membrane protein YfbV (UPF0208 family)